MAYTSVVDYLKAQGQQSDFSSRSVLAQQKGIQNYTGTAEQNIKLLNILQTPQGSQTPQNTQNPQNTPISTVQTTAPTTDLFAYVDPTTGLRTNTPPTAPVAPPVAPVDTTAPTGSTTTPELPTPTATDTTNAYFTSLQASLDASRKALEDTYKKQLEDLKTKQDEAQKKIDDFNKQQQTLIEGDIKTALTPFRADLEKAERQRLYIDENFEANQKLTNELGTLLTEGNALIEQQRAVTGLAAIRDPRVAKTISDVSARAGVIEAVMNARSGQIAEAYRMIDRSVAAMTADRQDQLNYYSTLLNFYEGKKGIENTKLVNITKDQKDFLSTQIGLLETDLSTAQENADNLKEAMQDPDTALAYAEAGVTLNDTPEQIATKLAAYAYTKEVRATSDDMGRDGYTYLAPGQSVPAGYESQITTDSKGVTKTWIKKQEVKTTGVSAPLSILDVQRYQEAYPEAGVTAGDTEATANGKVAALTAPQDFSDEELRVAATNSKDTEKKTFEETIAEIDSNPIIKNKERAKQIVEEVYGKNQVSTEKTPKSLKSDVKSVNQRVQELGEGFDVGVSNAINSIFNYLFK